MEMRVESVDGFALPMGCHVAIRVGDILKQGKYEPQRCYYFPQADRRRNAKVDLYQHVGSCVLAVDPEVKSTHEVNVTSTVATFPGTKLRVFVQSSSPEQQKKQQEAKGKEVKSQARAYLAQHCVEERLGEAVKALLKKQPEDPWEFLCQWLQPAPAPPAQDKALGGSEGIRQKVGDRLLQSLDDGSFEKALSEMHQAKQMSRPHVDEIRSRTCEALVDAAKDGSLQQILKETQMETTQLGDSEALKARAREVLHSALASGQLQQALQDVLQEEKRVAKPSGDLMAKAKDVLEKSAANGELEKALQEIRGAKKADPGKLAEASKAVVKASGEEIRAVLNSLNPEAHRKLRGAVSGASLFEVAKSLETASAEETSAMLSSWSDGNRQKLDMALNKVRALNQARLQEAVKAEEDAAVERVRRDYKW